MSQDKDKHEITLVINRIQTYAPQKKQRFMFGFEFSIF